MACHVPTGFYLENQTQTTHKIKLSRFCRKNFRGDLAPASSPLTTCPSTCKLWRWSALVGFSWQLANYYRGSSVSSPVAGLGFLLELCARENPTLPRRYLYRVPGYEEWALQHSLAKHKDAQSSTAWPSRGARSDSKVSSFPGLPQR